MIKKVVISMHDACPVFQKEIEIVMKAIIQKKSFLITPLWHETGALDEDFADLMKTQDTLLHGLTHRSGYVDPCSILFMNKKISREFLYLTYEATRKKIALGIKLFEDHLGMRPKGFIPPMWYHNRHLMEVLKEMEFCYTETWTSFVNLKKEQTFHSFPLSLDYGRNNLLSTLYLKSWENYLKWKKPSFIRLAIHPSDVSNGMLSKIKEIIMRLEDRDYTFVTYAELLNDLN